MPGLLAILFAGCNGANPPAPFDGTIVLGDENNFTYVGSVDLSSVEVAAGQDAEVDWGALTTDLQGHPIDAADDVDEVLLTRFSDELGEEDVETLIAEDELESRHVFVAFVFENPDARTSARLTEFEILGNEFVPAEYLLDDGAAWATSVSTDDVPSFRMSQFVSPTDGSGNTRIEITDDSGALDFQADLTTLTAIEIPEADEYVIDWSGVTVNGLGKPIDSDKLEELLIGRYDGMTVEELESRMLELEGLAAVKYTMGVRGQDSADPADALDETGEPFPGFGSGTTWLLVLRCSGRTCTNPTPQILNVLHVE